MSYFKPLLLAAIALVALIYQLSSRKLRPYILLLASYLFIYMASKQLIIYILLATFAIHYFGLWLEMIEKDKKDAIKEVDRSLRKPIKARYQRRKKAVLTLGVLLLLSVLYTFKYVPFFSSIYNDFAYLFKLHPLKIHRLIAPIGISYYTLQCIAYLADVYLGKRQAEKSLPHLALFVAYFPQIMEGPIVRASDTLDQLFKGDPITFHSLTFGLQRIFYGLFKKYVIADRLNIPVTLVFTNYTHYHGGTLFLGMFGYTMMLYLEFSGTMDVVLGISEVFQIHLPENFRQPFFAKNVSDFWTRWHITLGTFFRDYIYYPLSLSKPLKTLTKKARKPLGNHYGPLVSGAIALFCVWFCNGLWHGAGWTYLFYGLYHFTFILGESLIEPPVRWLSKKLHINRQAKPYRIFQSCKLCIFIFIGEMFFRCTTVSQGFAMLSRTIHDFTFSLSEVLTLGIDNRDLSVLILALAFVFVMSLLKEKGINVRESLAAQPLPIRWSLYYALVMAVVIFGAYGTGYIPVAAIYADF